MSDNNNTFKSTSKVTDTIKSAAVTGKVVYNRIPLIEGIIGKTKGDVRIILANAKLEFNSDLINTDGFKVGGIAYKYKFTKSGGVISDVLNEKQKLVASVLYNMITNYTNKTE